MNQKQRKHLTERVERLKTRAFAAVTVLCTSEAREVTMAEIWELLRSDHVALRRSYRDRRFNTYDFFGIYDPVLDLSPEASHVLNDAQSPTTIDKGRKERETAVWSLKASTLIDFAMLTGGDEAVALIAQFEKEVKALEAKAEAYKETQK